MLLAHSENRANVKQSYFDHISHVSDKAVAYAISMGPYTKYGPLLKICAMVAGYYHDVGKIPIENQRFLDNPIPGEPLPFPHSDPGVAALLKKAWKQNKLADMIALICALLDSSHHRGLVDFNPREIGSKVLRDNRPAILDPSKKVSDITDENLIEWMRIHVAEMKKITWEPLDKLIRLPGIFYRMGLSCLVDGDHTDTGQFYGSIVAESQNYFLRPLERLEALKKYVNKKWESCDQRKDVNKIRNDLFKLCASLGAFDEGIVSCNAAVGNGKTTAVMAHLLRAANEFGLRKIFVVLPFTNIIDQSVKVYREALTLPGEDPKRVISAHHHRVDFDFRNYDGIYTMSHTKLWRSPITVTTAVQFFETLGSNRPARLRKLHELPGSAIFFDEAHAMLPEKLLPLGYKWIQELVDGWKCYVALGSGTQTNFWNLNRFSITDRKIPEIQDKSLSKRTAKKEKRRIGYYQNNKIFNRKKLTKFVLKKKGPRIVVMNTVNNAAMFASYLKKQEHDVEHLSTCLTHEDQAAIIARIKQRFIDKQTDWTLVCTSIVEAGMDFSFRVGFREWNGILSIIQVGGRINRNCEYKKRCLLYLFGVDLNDGFTEHNMFRARTDITKEMLRRKKNPFNLTNRDVINFFKKDTIGGVPANKDPMVVSERNTEFKTVNEKFNVIEEDGTVTAILNFELFQAIERGDEKIHWNDIQKKSVRMPLNKRTKVFLEVSSVHEQLYYWNGRYDSFIGYFAQFYGSDPIVGFSDIEI